jgi:hypothetical protein
METTGIKKRNGTAFASFITQAFASNQTYRDIKPFFEVISTGAITPGTIDVV